MKRRDIVPISGKNIDYLILGGKNIVEDKTIKILRILVIIMLNVFLIGLVANLSGTGSIMTLSKYGSRGNEVRQIQTRLKELGYNPGTIDGIYGTNTQNAVKAFQRDKGLSVDGIAGPKTLKALGISSGILLPTPDTPKTISICWRGSFLRNRVGNPTLDRLP